MKSSKNKIRDQIWNRVYKQVGNQIQDQARHQIWDHVRTPICNQVENEIQNQVWDKVWRSSVEKSVI
jgi:hypothetical protein